MANLLTLVIASVVALAAYPSLANNNVPTIVPRHKELLLKVGTTQYLNCSVTSPSYTTDLQWTYPISEKLVAMRKSMNPLGSLYTFNAMLQILNFDEASAGVYRCSVKGNDTVLSSEISLIAVAENKTEPRYVKDEAAATLFCSISFESNRSITGITWLKVTNKSSGRTEEFVSKLKNADNYKEENTSLTISNPKIDDAGLYIARFTINGDETNTYDCEVGFEAAPEVQNFEKAKNLIEGEKMELMCTVKGYPLSVVTWYKDNNVLNVSEGSRHEIQKPFGEHQVVKLLVQTVEFEDAGDYTCRAYSAQFNETSEKTLTVRVKDKLAALWPFLGIVGEVVVLCTIIFIYEKRRNKQVQQEEKAAEEVDGSAADKKEGLRHRNTNTSA
ncbi:unnamed protein product [Candidula unifasciata]|uniref:Ig-like domain-containing protein n=1 Tax=Candidula unifasciata TaxID=100452 RepID=A0A8S3ZNU2_9EUPU|nr:unnamed protein product [Candidula unifasciata]